MSAVGREDFRENGEDLRALGNRVSQLSEEHSFLAQSYRNLYERLRLAQGSSSEPTSEPGEGTDAQETVASGHPRRSVQASLAPVPSGGTPRPPTEELAAVRRTMHALLERQGELGSGLRSLARHPLFLAGGEEPRRIRARLNELGEKFQNLRLSADALIRRDARAVSAVLDDLCELNSVASEDLVRFGQRLRSRGDGILAGRKEDRRFLRGDSWRRPS